MTWAPAGRSAGAQVDSQVKSWSTSAARRARCCPSNCRTGRKWPGCSRRGRGSSRRCVR
jgi:hypothetical protein